MNKRLSTAIVICLLVIGAVLALGACAVAASPPPQDSIESRVQTAAAATLVQYMIETEVAAQSVALASTPAAEAQATQPPAPTPTATLLPTATPPPTATLVPAPTLPPAPTQPPAPAPVAGPQIIADENTNCRVGPSTAFVVVSTFMQGSESTVQGIDQGKNWWYIVDPENAGGFCWVWEGSTTVVGDTSTLPVVAAPPKPNTTANYYYPYNPYYNCGAYPYACNPYANNCVKNPYNIYWQNCVNYQPVCNPYINCKNPCKPVCKNPCKPVCKNPCKQPSCPPLTSINWKKYCSNYPACCNAWYNNKQAVQPYVVSSYK